MTYTNLELLRKQIADPLKYATDKQLGDAQTVKFKLSHERIQDSTYEVFVDGVKKTVDVDFTVDLERGIFTFLSAPANDKEVEINYYFSAFSDEELNEFLTLENNHVNRACLRCIDILLMDSARRFDYSAGQTEIKASQVFSNLEKLRKMFQDNISSSGSGSTGGVKIVDRLDSHYQEVEDRDIDLSRYDL